MEVSACLDTTTELAGHLALGGALGHVLALVVVLLTLCQCEFDLDLAVVEVHRQRDQRLVSLAGLADEVLDLTLVQQELSGTTWRMVVPRALRVLRNVQRAQPHFAVVHRGERVDERRLAFTQTLDLGPDESDAGLVGVDDRVVVACFAIGRNDLAALFLHCPGLSVRCLAVEWFLLFQHRSSCKPIIRGRTDAASRTPSPRPFRHRQVRGSARRTARHCWISAPRCSLRRRRTGPRR